MCGLAGIFETDAGRAADPATVRLMADALVHRGPDGSGFYQQQNVGFGFRRLALNDLVRGDQPFTNEAGSVVSMCNGEIYNYRELRARLLARGHRLSTNCDCEILPHLYEEYGPALVEHLDGQFALVVYDRDKSQLLLARDQFGVHPLFYAVVGGTFLFASEIKAILRHPRMIRAVNLTGLDQILCFPGLVSPTTMFRDVHSLPSGHRLLVSARGLEVTEYWDLDYPRLTELADGADEERYVEGVAERLAASTAARASADADVGIYISGGLDSAVVAGVCKSHSDAPRRSFSVLFPNQEMDEARHQRRVVQYAGTVHHEVPFKAADVVTRLAEAVYHAECPLKETYNTACLALSEAARFGGVKAVLTGQGADELFAGYVGYKFDKFKGGNGVADVGDGERRIREALWGDAGIPYEGNYAELARLKGELYSPALWAGLGQFDAFNSLPVKRERLEGRHPAHQRSYLDFKLRLADHLLSDHGDRMAMANAIEMRHPFLDRALVDFARIVPPDLNLKNFEEKYILRRAAAKFVPPQIATREKFGWFAPGTPSLVRAGNSWVEEMLSPERIRRQGYFNAETVERLKRQYAASGFRLNHPFETDLLAIVLTFNVFLEVFEMPALN
jgi:asparagine synthase (glutamine-hydrolysing)